MAGSGSSALSYSVIATTSTASQLAVQNALSAVNNAITTVGTARGLLGAAESRLNSAINYLTVARENFIAAESRIRDADVAQEVANLVRLQVLQQAGTAVLAQANQQPQYRDSKTEHILDEQFCLQNANGICSRSLTLQMAKRAKPHLIGSPTIFFPEYCWNRTPKGHSTSCRREKMELNVATDRIKYDVAAQAKRLARFYERLSARIQA